MFKQQIYNLIEKSLKNLGISQMPVFRVSYPPDPRFGDYSTNAAIVAAKILKKPPMEIADAIKSNVESRMSKVVGKIQVAPPGFINFTLKREIVQKNLANILKLKNKYGSSKVGKRKTVIIDYSAPNIAKMMHVGHLRSTIIGQAIYNIYSFLGYRVIGDSHIGDWGTQFGKLIYAYKYFADKKKLKKNFIGEITKLYVDFNARAKLDIKLDGFAREETKKFQEGDRKNVKIWKYFVRQSIKEFNRIYRMLGIKIDYTLGESFYHPMLKSIIQEALKKNVAVFSQGAVIIPLEKYNMPPFMIRKSDGATLYGTTDLATIKYRKKKWKPAKIIYVVANEQAGHLAQLFKAAEILGYIKHGEAIHVKFGMVLGFDGKKFSTREGKIVLLENLLNEAIGRAYKIAEEKNQKLPAREKKNIAAIVGIGAMKYNDLSQNRLSDIVFDWDKMLNFSGNSAPYLQYTYARIRSILRKSKMPKKYNAILLTDPKEAALLKSLAKFPEAIEEASAQYNPNIIANYLYILANHFNLLYEALPVLKAEKDLRQARLALILSVSIVIKNGLKLLGIEVLEKM